MFDLGGLHLDCGMPSFVTHFPHDEIVGDESTGCELNRTHPSARHRCARKVSEIGALNLKSIRTVQCRYIELYGRECTRPEDDIGCSCCSAELRRLANDDIGKPIVVDVLDCSSANASLRQTRW